MTQLENAGSDSIGLDAALVPRRAIVDDFLSDGECLVYNSSRDQASALNRTATEIWQLCDGALSIGAIARILGQRYGVDKDFLLEDVARALFELRTLGLVAFPADSVPDQG